MAANEVEIERILKEARLGVPKGTCEIDIQREYAGGKDQARKVKD